MFQAVNIGLEENFNEQLNARLLPGKSVNYHFILQDCYHTVLCCLLTLYLYCCLGEAVVAEAQNVLMYAPLSEKQGKSGILTVTNFKLSFVTTEENHREVK